MSLFICVFICTFINGSVRQNDRSVIALAEGENPQHIKIGFCYTICPTGGLEYIHIYYVVLVVQSLVYK